MPVRDWSSDVCSSDLYLITSYEDFEKEFGQEADKRRKLYNGMLKTNLYQYIGPRPPKK